MTTIGKRIKWYDQPGNYPATGKIEAESGTGYFVRLIEGYMPGRNKTGQLVIVRKDNESIMIENDILSGASSWQS